MNHNTIHNTRQFQKEATTIAVVILYMFVFRIGAQATTIRNFDSNAVDPATFFQTILVLNTSGVWTNGLARNGCGCLETIYHYSLEGNSLYIFNCCLPVLIVIICVSSFVNIISCQRISFSFSINMLHLTLYRFHCNYPVGGMQSDVSIATHVETKRSPHLSGVLIGIKSCYTRTVHES